MKQNILSVFFTAALATVTVSAQVDCVTLTRTVTKEIASDESQVLAIVSKYVSAEPGCVCEVVKAAIKSIDANKKEAAAIVEAAIIAAPDHRRLIGECATAAFPDAASEIQAVLARLSTNSEISNPLNFPGINPQGSPLSSFNNGGTGGGTTGGGGGIGGGGLGSLLGNLPAGGLPGGFIGGTPGSGGITPGVGPGGDFGGGGGGVVNPPPVTTPNPPRRPPGRPPVR